MTTGVCGSADRAGEACGDGIGDGCRDSGGVPALKLCRRTPATAPSMTSAAPSRVLESGRGRGSETEDEDELVTSKSPLPDRRNGCSSG